MRLTVVGSGTSQPQPETPASGLLIETETTAILVDCGQGIIRELMAIRDPRELDAIVIGHMHADHYIDLVSLRYLLPWEGVAGAHIPVLLPPGRQGPDRRARDGDQRAAGVLRRCLQRPRVRPGPSAPRRRPDDLVRPGPALRARPGAASSAGPTARRIAISGDTGPSAAFAAAARGADLVVAEATLADAELDDPRRGHLTAEEALEMADRAGAAQSCSSTSGPSSGSGSSGLRGAPGRDRRAARARVEVPAGRTAGGRRRDRRRADPGGDG